MDFWTESWSGPRVGTKVYVVAGNQRETAAGLRAARSIASKTGQPIVLLVAHLVPYGTDVDACGHNLEQIGARYLPLAAAAGADAEVRVCACRETRHLFARMLLDEAVVVVAGTRRRWWRSAPERLAHALECEGHRVTFVDVGAPGSHRRGIQPSLVQPGPRIVHRGSGPRPWSPGT